MKAVRIAVLFAACACTSPHGSDASTRPADWTAFRLNRELNAVVSPADSLAVRWTAKTGAGISSSPTLSGDTLFVASNDHRLYAFDVRTGRVRWSYGADNELMTAPLVVAGTVVVGEGDNNAINYDPNDYGLLGSGPSGILGVDARTGKARWQWRVPGSAMTTGAVIDGMYEQHDAAGMLFALNIADGTYRWREYLRSTAAMSAANNFRGTDVVSAGNYPNAVIDFDGTNGRVIWRATFPKDASSFADCPQASDGRFVYGMYFGRPADSAFHFVGFTTPGIQRAYALDGRSGKAVWDVPLARGTLAINNHASIPLVYRNALYLGSPVEPTVFALDARSGRMRWRRSVSGTVQGGLVGVGRAIYFGDRRGRLWAVDAATGAVLGAKKMRDGFSVGSPIVVGKTLFIGSAHGYVFAIPLSEIERSRDFGGPTVPAAARPEPKPG